MQIIKDFIVKWWPSMLTLAAVLWLTLSSDPVPDMGDLAFPHLDKIVHFIMFGGLTGAVMFDALRAKKIERRRLSLTFYFILGISMIVFAFADETAQGAMQNGRSQDIMDFLADSGGIVTALCIGAPIINRLLRLTCMRQRQRGARRPANRG